MSMDRVTVRVPSDIVRAYDKAEGNRSALMRRRLSEAVENGELTGVPDDLQTLAERENIIDRGRLSRKRATFRTRAAEFFASQWSGGGVTPDDADELAHTWRKEGSLYGSAYIAYVDAILEWYRTHYDPLDRPAFPDAGEFIAKADPSAVDLERHLVETLSDAADKGLSKQTAIERVSEFHPTAKVRAAAERAYGDENEPTP